MENKCKYWDEEKDGVSDDKLKDFALNFQARINNELLWENEQLKLRIEALQPDHYGDCISRKTVLKVIETVCFSDAWRQFRADYGSNGERDYIINYIKQMPSTRPDQTIIMCKDCDEWDRGKNYSGYDVRSDMGYCSVMHTVVGENYYCGDAVRK